MLLVLDRSFCFWFWNWWEEVYIAGWISINLLTSEHELTCIRRFLGRIHQTPSVTHRWSRDELPLSVRSFCSFAVSQLVVNRYTSKNTKEMYWQVVRRFGWVGGLSKIDEPWNKAKSLVLCVSNPENGDWLKFKRRSKIRHNSSDGKWIFHIRFRRCRSSKQ